MSYRYRIYLTIAGFAVVAAIFFLWIFPAMNAKNQTIADTVQQKNQSLAEAQAEQQSYEQGKKDLQSLKSKPLQPEDLFSQDTKLVKEISTLEDAARDAGLKFTLQIAGTAKDASKLSKTTSQLSSVPYNVTLEGPFDKTVNFMEHMEQMPFVTQTKTVSISALTGGDIRTSLASEFYIRP